MASDLNNVNLVGRLTRDPELRQTAGGTPVAEIGLAVNRTEKDGEGWRDAVSFFNVTIFGKRAESVTQFCAKGDRLAISGSLQQQRWESENGKREKIGIIANQVQFLTTKAEKENKSTNEAAPQEEAGF